MAVVRKVQSKIQIAPRARTEENKGTFKRGSVRESENAKEFQTNKSDSRSTKKKCYFCQNSLEPSYTDASNLRRYVNDRGRIYARTRSGACAKHQRRVSKQIKYARHLALLPFTIRV